MVSRESPRSPNEAAFRFRSRRFSNCVSLDEEKNGQFLEVLPKNFRCSLLRPQNRQARGYQRMIAHADFIGGVVHAAAEMF